MPDFDRWTLSRLKMRVETLNAMVRAYKMLEYPCEPIHDEIAAMQAAIAKKNAKIARDGHLLRVVR